jgi:hypothetical protein
VRLLVYSWTILFIVACSDATPTALPKSGEQEDTGGGLEVRDDLDGLDDHGFPAIGDCDGISQEFSITGQIGQDAQLCAEDSYEFHGTVLVPNGVTLSIEAGTVVQFPDRGEGLVGELLFERGSVILAQGTVDSPIVFRGGDHGGWGGLLIAGRGPSNASPEGDSTDSSGVLNYVRIISAGLVGTNVKSTALVLRSVGSGTTVSHVEVLDSAGDGVLLTGGTVNLDHIVVRRAQRDAIKWQFGYTGTLKYALLDSVNQLSGLHGIQSRRPESTMRIRSHPQLQNITINAAQGHAVRFRLGTGAELSNSIILGSSACSVYVDDQAAEAVDLSIHHVIVFWSAVEAICEGRDDGDGDARLFSSNVIVEDPMLDAFVPMFGSPALDPERVDLSVSNHLGAFEDEDWTAVWTD